MLTTTPFTGKQSRSYHLKSCPKVKNKVWEACMRNEVHGCGRGCLGGLLWTGVKLADRRLRSWSGSVESAKHGNGNTTRDMQGIGFGVAWTHHTVAGSGSGVGTSRRAGWRVAANWSLYSLANGSDKFKA